MGQRISKVHLEESIAESVRCCRCSCSVPDLGGSPGSFLFAQNPEDAAAVLAYLRGRNNADQLGIDTKRIVLVGHSMGGWVTAMAAACDHKLLGAILISAANFRTIGSAPRQTVVEFLADNQETLAGVTSEKMADEVIHHAKEFGSGDAAEGLSRLPLWLAALK